MGRWRTVLALFLLTVPVAPLQASAAPASSFARSRGRIPALGAKSIFRTDATRSMLVELPQPVDVRRDFSSHVAGGGRYAGYILAKLGGPVQWGGTPYLNYVRPGWCSKHACRTKPQAASPFGYNFDRYLPAGTYRLYQVADGPMTLTIRLDSLEGVLRARPNEPLDSEIRTLRPTASTPSSTVYAAGEWTPLRDQRADFAAMGMWIKASPHVVTGYGECFYEPQSLDGQILPREIAFAPNCPTGENLWMDGYPQYQVSSQEEVTEKEVRFSISYSGWDTSGVGGWFDSAAGVSEVGMVGLWLNFRGKNSVADPREEVK